MIEFGVYSISWNGVCFNGMDSFNTQTLVQIIALICNTSMKRSNYKKRNLVDLDIILGKIAIQMAQYYKSGVM